MGTLNGFSSKNNTFDDAEVKNGRAKRVFGNGGKASSIILGIKIFVIIIILWAISADAFYTIGENQQGVVTLFGNPLKTVGPGFGTKIPIIENVYKVDTTIRGETIGYTDDGDGNYSSVSDESLMITSDYNFVNVDFYVEYRVTDPEKYLFASEEPELILKNICQGCIRATIGSYDVDAVITTGKNEIQSDIKSAITEKLEEADIGLMLNNITIQDAEPPTDEVKEAFKEVENAKQGMDTAVNNAEKYQSEQQLAAEAEVDSIAKDAKAQKVNRIAEANGQVARFNEMYEQYKLYPKVTKTRMFYEAMEDVLPNLKVIIDGTDKTDTVLPLDSFTDPASAAESSDSTAADDSVTGNQASDTASSDDSSDSELSDPAQ